MNYTGSDAVLLTRETEVIAIPAGHSVTLPKGTEVMVTQALGGSYTLMVPTYGGLFRLVNKNADAIGKEVQPEAGADTRQPLSGENLTKEVWQTFKTCYDPEIPVNIYELGLVYGIEIGDAGDVRIKMTLTAPNCPVAASLPLEVESKVIAVEGVKSAQVELVWDPPWNPEKMSEGAKLELGMI